MSIITTKNKSKSNNKLTNTSNRKLAKDKNNKSPPAHNKINDLLEELTNLDLEIDRNKTILCEESFYYFVGQAWQYVDAAPYQEHLSTEIICAHLQAAIEGVVSLRKLVINCIPRLGKSVICSVLFPVWAWIRNPTLKLLTCSHSDDLANDFTTKSRRLIECPWFRERWGDRVTPIKGQNTKSRMDLIQKGQRIALTPRSKTLGFPADLIILDDVNDVTSSNSSSDCEHVAKVWYEQGIKSRFNVPAKGITVVVQQRLGDNDISGHIADTDETFFFVRLPMEFRADLAFDSPIGFNDTRRQGELLWEERFDRDFVYDRQKNPYMYAALYQQDPIPSSGGIIKGEWLRYYDQPLDSLIQQNAYGFREFDDIIVSGDLATEIKDTTDYSTFTVWGVFKHKAYLLDISRGKLEFFEQLDVLKNLCLKYDPSKVVLENHGNANPLSKTLKTISTVPVELIHASGKGGKTDRLLSVIHLFVTGRIVLPTEKLLPDITAYAKELIRFPRARYDDQVDATTWALIYFTQISNILSERTKLDVNYDAEFNNGSYIQRDALGRPVLTPASYNKTIQEAFAAEDVTRHIADNSTWSNLF